MGAITYPVEATGGSVRILVPCEEVIRKQLWPSHWIWTVGAGAATGEVMGVVRVRAGEPEQLENIIIRKRMTSIVKISLLNLIIFLYPPIQALLATANRMSRKTLIR